MVKISIASLLNLSAVCIFLTMPAYSQMTSWVPIDDVYEGSISDVTFSIPGSFFVTGEDGCFRSTDDGGTWTRNSISNSHPNNLGYSPWKVLYAQTASGIFSSTDNGDTWTRRSDYSGSVKLAFSNLGAMFTARLNFSQTSWEISRSLDSGKTWIVVQLLQNYEVSGIVAAPNGNVFVGSKNVSDPAAGIARSTDNGQTWTVANTGLTHTGIFSLSVDSSGYLFAATGDGIFRSTNNGGIWQPINTGLPIRWLFHMTCDPSAIVYAAETRRIFKSTNRGLTWTEVNTPAVEWIAAKGVNVDGSGALYFSTSTGLFRSTNQGASFQQLNVTRKASIKSLLTTKTGDIIAGTNKGGFYRLLPDGSGGTIKHVTWFNDPCIALETDQGGTVYAVGGNSALLDGYLYKSTNDGHTWQYLNFPEPNVSPGYALTAVKVKSNGTIFIGSDRVGLFRSTDYGASFTQSNSGLTNLSVLSLAINSSGNVFVGTNGGGVYRSSNDGATFTQIISGLSSIWITSMAINASDVIFAGTNYGGGVFKSSDNGNNWTQAGLTDQSALTLLIDSFGNLFAGTESGTVFRSTNNAVSWTKLDGGLPITPINSLTLNSSGVLFAGTDSGLFRHSQPLTFAENNPPAIPKNHALSQNYPNPFNPITTIKFSLPKEEHVSLRIVSLLGEDIATLVSERFQAGTHSVRWNATTIPSGVYFYRLQAGEFTETKKLILLK